MRELEYLPTINALADPIRFRIMRLLLKGAHCVNEIADRLRLQSYNTSKHLGVLRSAGLVETKVVGQKRRYAVVESLRAETTNRNELDVGWGVFHFDSPWQFSLVPVKAEHEGAATFTDMPQPLLMPGEPA